MQSIDMQLYFSRVPTTRGQIRSVNKDTHTHMYIREIGKRRAKLHLRVPGLCPMFNPYAAAN